MSLRLKTKTVREISGSWIHFQHPVPAESEYWSDAAKSFSSENWEEKVTEMANLGLETLVVGATVLNGKAFYPSTIVPDRWDHTCEDPLEAVLSAADRLGMEVFVGPAAGQVDNGPQADLPRELHDRYGAHRSFHGWYLPTGAIIDGYFSDEYIKSANAMARHCREPDPKRPVLVAPLGTHSVKEDARFVEQLRALEIDHIAYRDEVGVRKSEPSDLAEIFGRLARLHEKADRPLWAAAEIFAFEGPTHESALLPAPFSRIKSQIEALSPHVKKLLCDQYLGMMNAGSTNAFAGHSTSAGLHHDYHEWRCEQGTD